MDLSPARSLQALTFLLCKLNAKYYYRCFYIRHKLKYIYILFIIVQIGVSRWLSG